MNESEKRKLMISVRGGYSDRNGLNPVCNVMQVDDLDDRTRKMLVNKIWEVVDINTTPAEWCEFVKELLIEVFEEIVSPNNNLAKSKFDIFHKIKNVILQAPIEQVWDIIEFICKKPARIFYDKEVIDAQIRAYYGLA